MGREKHGSAEVKQRVCSYKAGSRWEITKLSVN